MQPTPRRRRESQRQSVEGGPRSSDGQTEAATQDRNCSD